MRFAIESLPPFMMAGLRFSVAGVLLYIPLRLYGSPVPSKQQWLNATLVGSLLLVLGNATVAYAEKTVSSALAALALSTVPVWMALLGMFWKQTPSKREWLGIALGIIGVASLNLGNHMQASPLGAILLLLAAASWALGSAWGKRLDMPAGMMANAAQMLMGGLVLFAVSALLGETWPQQVSAKSWAALAYLVVFASMIGYSAYWFLLTTVRPALATSNTFVNPVVAMILGVYLANEAIGPAEYLASAIILLGVVLVLPWGIKSVKD